MIKRNIMTREEEYNEDGKLIRTITTTTKEDVDVVEEAEIEIDDDLSDQIVGRVIDDIRIRFSR